MLNKLFGKKQAEPIPSPILEHDQIWPQLPTRQRFRRTRSAASESVYADYVSDDWGVAPTILHDRYGEEIRRTPSINSLEEWQRNTNANANALFRNVSARVRSLSLSRPNWSRVPPTSATPTYGWAQRVEQAGGPDERQRMRDSERSRRPVAIPVPNPAPGPIDVRRDDNPGLAAAEGTPSALQPPALVRQKSSTRRDDATKAGRIPLEHRSTTSSPTIIPHDQTPGAGPSGKPGPDGRRHLSRVEKIAAVIQHVASLPLFAETPVQTYYPRTDKDKLEDQKAKGAPAEPFHAYSVPPSVPKRYRPPPVSLSTGWYQPKPPKVKKPKKDKDKPRKTKTNLGGAMGDDAPDFDFSDEFEYPDFDNYAYTGDTPTLQSDESSMFYEQVHPKMIEGAPFTIRPAYFPGPIKSTGLTTHGEQGEEAGRGILRIMPPPPGDGEFESGVGGFVAGAGPGLAPIPGAYGYDYGYDYGEYEDDESESSRGPIPSTLTPSGTAAPPLVIPTPTGRHPPMSFPVQEPSQPYSKHYTAASGADQAPPLPGGYGSAQGWHPTERRPSAQALGHERGQSAQGWGLPERKRSAQGWGHVRSQSAQEWGPTERKASAQGWGYERRPSAQGWGVSPGPARGMSAQGWGLPDRRPSAQDLGIPTRKPFEPPAEPADGGWGEPAGGGWGEPPAGGWGDSTGDEWAESGEEGWGQPVSDGRGRASAQGWGRSPAEGWGQSPEEGWGELPKRRPSAQDWSKPSPMAYGFPQPPYVFGPPPHGRGYEPAPQVAYGSTPYTAYGPSPHTIHGRSPHTPYGPSPGAPPPPLGPSPQFAYGPSPQYAYGPSPQTGYPPYPYNYYPQPVWDPYGVVPEGFHVTDSPRGKHRGDSPPPVPSPIATSVALSRTSRRRSEAA